ncbi:hypothetical protein DVH24_013379 [Malus domestica]|uniref:Protein kinase domain-containing protein n=1 Tax=Malus domestica TaxID=3750 RepID=A0A498HNZ7_MALDO|nr:hypothetical protein DVH24_013379 [Malus domestica]
MPLFLYFLASQTDLSACPLQKFAFFFPGFRLQFSMQVPNSDEAAPEGTKVPEQSEAEASNPTVEDEDCGAAADGDDDPRVVDISGKSLDFSIRENSEDAGALYLYKNVFNLLPKSIGSHKRLRTLKFFGNEINLFSPSAAMEFESLECLQVRMSSPEFGGLPLDKLIGLKELELSKVLTRPSGFQILSEIARLKCLTKLSVCHFSIRYLPPEIGCLNTLEYLDLSFNKMKNLPAEISNLNALISLKVANNKLVELPSTLSSLQRLEIMDLSNNRLTSLGSLELDLMHNLQILNLQYNTLLNFCQIPSWICCNLEGSGKDTHSDDVTISPVEMDVYEIPLQKNNESHFRRGFHHNSASLIFTHSSTSRCCATRRSGRWRKQGYRLQLRTRQERLNNSRKLKGLDLSNQLHVKEDGECKPGNPDLLASESYLEGASDIINLHDDGEKDLQSREVRSENVVCYDMNSKEHFVGNSSSVSPDSSAVDESDEKDCCEFDASLAPNQRVYGEDYEGSSSDTSKSICQPKRHLDGHLDNPRRPKHPRYSPNSSNLSRKYNDISVCSTEDHLSDGFYDAGRDRPFMPLELYDEKFRLDSREVILVDRQWDKELDVILRSAQELVNRLNTDGNKADMLQIASLLALFVSDHFGGSDRSALVEWSRKANPLSDYKKPFVCTCPTGNKGFISLPTKPVVRNVENIVFSDVSEKSLHSIKARRNSIVVPIGTLQFGVCRHRALLLKYLCDWVEPRVPCELIRGYLDFMPHAWNNVLIKRGAKEIRMLVDACRPCDIRAETDPEYYCRYVPLSRTKVYLPIRNSPAPTSFPSMPSCDETLKNSVTSLVRRKYGSNEAAGKMRTSVVYGTPTDEIRNFDYNCLGEIRILGALKHPCIVEMYGHQISSEWVPPGDGSREHRILQSIIWMEDIKGGSLQNYIEKLSKAGEKHLPVELALCIAKNVACALVELHSKHIIHRDIKSANILIDLDRKRADGTPVVKLCDFDRAIPLRSYLHTCCIAHVGIPPANVCAGTPRWMAPEVLLAVHEQNIYGLEIDIWSFGCLLLEMLTLQIPYFGVPDLEIHELLTKGKRPNLTDDLEAFRSLNEPVMTQAGAELDGTEADFDKLRFLVDLFYQCTEENPENRPTADNLHELILEHSKTHTNSET